MSASEAQPLLRQSSTTTSSLQNDLSKVHCWPKYICLPSKSAILIILWSIVVGTVFTVFIGVIVDSTLNGHYVRDVNSGLIVSIPQALLALIMTLYPVSGFIADICCGRFKTVIVSAYIILLSLVVLSIVTLIIAIEQIGINYKFNKILAEEGVLVSVLFLLFVSFLLFIVGLAGYQANFIQLGLDQLLEAPSEYLALFTHWATWAFNLSSVVFITVVSMFHCLSQQHSTSVVKGIPSIPLVLLFILLVLLLVSHWKHRWFYSEPGQYNPYRTVFKVLNFARKHNRPIRRSAFTFSDNYIPTRIDFAKERYGGPFTTEQVENVKTLFRLLLLLFSLGPTYVLEVPTSHYFFSHFGQHIGYHYFLSYHHDCSAVQLWTIVVENGGLTALMSSILLPLYIWCVFSVFRRKLPKMFTRLKLGIVLCFLGVFSLLITDLVGHSVNNSHKADNNTELMCMFKTTKTNNTLMAYQHLEMNWSVLILPSVFLRIGPPLVTATTLEFISAQSPHSMKGLLVGVSFAIRGLSQLIGYLIILLISFTRDWSGGVVSCEFIYLLFAFIVGLIGFVLFTVIAKKYKYRERDDENFSQREVEEVYSRYLTQAANINSGTSDNLDDEST